MSKKTIIALGIILLLLAGLGVGVYLVMQQQNLQEKAAPATTISITPSSKTIALGDTADFSVQMDTQTNTVTSATIEINYNPTLLSIESVSAGSFLPVVLSTPRIDSTTGTVKGTFGVNPSAPQQGIGVVATIKVKAKANGTSPLSFGSGTTASGLSESVNVISVKTPASVSISGTASGATPTASPVATSTPAPTSSATPTGATDSATVGAKPTVKLPANKTVKAGSTLTGTAVSNSTVSITIQSDPIITTVIASSAGTWSYTLPADLALGTHTLTIQDPNGTYTTSFTIVAADSTPVSGFEIPTYMLIYGGLAMAILGFGLAIKD